MNVGAVTALAIVSSCNSERPHSKSTAIDPIYSELVSVDPDLGLAYIDLVATREEHCQTPWDSAGLAHDSTIDRPSSTEPSPRGSTSDPDHTVAILNQRASEDSAICHTATTALTALRQPIAALRQSQQAPANAFAFSFFVESKGADSGAGHALEAIDVFPIQDLASCQEVEAIPREAGIPTKGCAAWVPGMQEPGTEERAAHLLVTN